MPLAEFGARVIIDPVALAKYIREPGGDVFRMLVVKGEVIKQGARRRVGVYRPEPGDPFASRRMMRRRPGTLRDSIVKRVATDGRGPLVIVGSDDEVALPHHEGTRPHTIRARRAPLLVFYTGGRVRRTLRVRHPGTAPNRYLTDSFRDL